ncbi:MAG TPA: NADH-quinone oxidoreductase subunit M [Gammaproteobacteria bacterium]
MHTLTLLLLMPVAGAIAIALLPANRHQWIRNLALLAAGAALLYSWSLLASFDTTIASLQFVEHHEWNPRLGNAYSIAIDGISFPMVLLATLLSFVAIMASTSIKKSPKGYYLLILLLESAMLGVFMAQDWSLFYVFWELTLIPLFFLIDRWGGERRHTAALNFVLYTMGGSVFMLISFLVLFDHSSSHSFAMAEMMKTARSLPAETQLLLFLGFLLGFGVKMPIFPIHGWLPMAHVEAPSPVSILLSGILLKMGAYGLIRAASMLPEAVITLQSLLATLALFSLVYGGLLAWRQSDLKRMIAYSSISHMGVVLLGIATLNIAGLTGALMQMVAHGLVAGATFLLIGLLYERTHTRDINHYCSLVRVTPRFAIFTTLAFIAAIGLPGTAGFVAELHTLIGGFERWGWVVVILTLGVLISAAYAVRTIGRLFTGPVHCDMNRIPDLKNSEMLTASVLTLGFLAIGFFPAPTLDLMTVSVQELSQSFTGRM